MKEGYEQLSDLKDKKARLKKLIENEPWFIGVDMGVESIIIYASFFPKDRLSSFEGVGVGYILTGRISASETK